MDLSSEIKEVEVALGFVTINGLFLCLKNNSLDSTYPNLWLFPTAKVNNNEEPIEALFKKIKKDTSLCETLAVNYVGKYKATIKKNNKIFKISVFHLFYNFPVHIKISDKFSDFKLCTFHELKKLDLAGPIYKLILKEYLNRLDISKEEE